MSIFIPIALAFFSSLIYSVNSTIARLVRHRNIPSLQFSADSSIVTGLLILSCFFYNHFLSGNPYTLREAYPIVLASYFMTSGTLLLNAALAYGKGGPTQALVQMQSPWQLFLTSVISGMAPNVMGLMGMASGLAGGFVMIFWNSSKK